MDWSSRPNLGFRARQGQQEIEAKKERFHQERKNRVCPPERLKSSPLAIHFTKYQVNDHEDRDESEAAASPFPPGIAGDQSP